jgi:capsule polysaccharide export protein KpsE/RkpR
MSSILNILPPLRIDPQATSKAIAADCAQRAAERSKEPTKLNLQHFSVLDREIGDLKFRLNDQQQRAPRLVSTVASLEQQTDDLRKAKKRLTDMGDVVNVWPQVQQLDKRIAHLEPELQHERRKLDSAEKLVASYTNLIAEWHQANDDEYDALRKIDAAIEAALPTQRSVSTR